MVSVASRATVLELAAAVGWAGAAEMLPASVGRLLWQWTELVRPASPRCANAAQMTSKTEGRRCASVAATPRKAKQPPPRRLGAAFAKMMGRCPKTVSAAPQACQKRHVNRRQVAAYGACVREKIADGALERDAYAREFAAMKKRGAAPKPPGVSRRNRRV